MEVEVLYVSNDKLSKDEAKKLSEKVTDLYKAGYDLREEIYLDKAGTLLVFLKGWRE